MKYYVAGKVNDGERAVTDLIDALATRGHTPSYNWTEALGIKKPYLNHVDENQLAADAMVQSVWEADVFILMWHPELLGALIELGVALGGNASCILIIGQDIRQSIFYCLNEVAVVNSAAEALQLIDQLYPNPPTAEQ